jgi:hypothetical protein
MKPVSSQLQRSLQTEEEKSAEEKWLTAARTHQLHTKKIGKKVLFLFSYV